MVEGTTGDHVSERGATAPPDRDAVRGKGGGRRILVIEDEPSIAEALRFILHRDGWSVGTQPSGHGAAARILAEQPDLVILDVMLPGPSGLDVLQLVRMNPATLQTPVILLSARSPALVRAEALPHGPPEEPTFFMAKPFANADLLAMVRRLAGV